MNTQKLLLTSSLVLVGALGLTACGSAETEHGVGVPPTIEVDPPQETDGDDTNNDATEPTESEVDEITRAALAAIELAENETGGVAYGLSDDENETQWEIDIVSGDRETEVHVNWAGTEVLRTEDDDRVDDDTRTKLESATLTIHEAITAAVPHAQGVGQGQLDDVELDNDNGTLMWKVSFEDGSTDIEVHINAQTGDLVKVEQDD